MGKLHDITIPPDAASIVDALEAAGHEAWVTGSYVRDMLMGRIPHDLDISTSARWETIRDLFSSQGFKVYETGTDRGTVTVNTGAHLVEITTFRTEEPIEGTRIAFQNAEHRKLSVWEPSSRFRFTNSVEKDLLRRDFTMNALAFNPNCGILDPFGGVKDISNETIRAVGEPSERFWQDPLRILRAARFASQLGFDVESRTKEAALASAPLLKHAQAQRIEAEFARLLQGDHARQAIMDWIDVIGVFIPEALPMKGLDQRTKYHIYDVLEHTAYTVSLAPQQRVLRYAAFLHDIGKPVVFHIDEEGVGHSPGHAAAGAVISEQVCSRLKLREDEAAEICTLVGAHDDRISPTPRSVRKALRRLGGNVRLLRELLELKKADALAHAPEHQERAAIAEEVGLVLDDVLKKEAAFDIKDLAIDGTDVIARGVPAGPSVGAALEAALDAVIDELVNNTRDDLLAFLDDRIAH